EKLGARKASAVQIRTGKRAPLSTPGAAYPPRLPFRVPRDRDREIARGGGALRGLWAITSFSQLRLLRRCNFGLIPATALSRLTDERPDGAAIFSPREAEAMTDLPMQKLAQALRQNGLIRFMEHFHELFPTTHMKDLVVDELGPHREMSVNAHHITN